MRHKTKRGARLDGRRVFQSLTRALAPTGMFERVSARFYLAWASIVVLGCGAGLTALLYLDWPWRAFFCLLIALSMVQGALLVHDLGHGSLSRSKTLSLILGHFIMSLLVGFPLSRWIPDHNKHHTYNNVELLDPALESGAGLFAFYPNAVSRRRGLARFIAQHQHVMLFVLASALQGVSLKLEGLAHLCRHPQSTRTEQALLALHFILWLIVPGLFIGAFSAVLAYVLVLWAQGTYFAGIVLVNHIGMATLESLDERSFVERQIAATRDIKSSRAADIITGGLTSHVLHHLYPRIPGLRLRRGRDVLRAFCREKNIEYSELSYTEAIRDVYRKIKKLAATARDDPHSNRHE